MGIDADRAVQELIAALREEGACHRAVEDASKRVCAAVDTVARVGVPSFKVAARVALALGRSTALDSKKRLAAALRKRRSRCCVTARHERPAAPSGSPPTGHSSSGSKEEAPMQKLVKKVTTVVEEFVEEGTEPANGQPAPLEKCFGDAAKGKEIRYEVESDEDLDDVDEDLDDVDEDLDDVDEDLDDVDEDLDEDGEEEEEEAPAKGRSRR